MSGNSFGKLFSITTFGESHGNSLGVIIDGMPSQIEINHIDLQKWVDKRAPGQSKVTTSRKEADEVVISSGIFENKTLGTPIMAYVKNKDQKSEDYDHLKNQFRLGHADKVTFEKYGIRDFRGGGRASGRETVSRVIAGYFASLIIPNITVEVTPIKIGQMDSDKLSPKEIDSYLQTIKHSNDSCGVELKVTIRNVPKSLGEPVFDKLKATLSHAMLSIGGCYGFSLGKGWDLAHSLGSQNQLDNRSFGGIIGGISTGDDVEFNLVFKAPSSIGDVSKKGRHDPCLYPRVMAVVESMSLIVLADAYLLQKVYQNEI